MKILRPRLATKAMGTAIVVSLLGLAACREQVASGQDPRLVGEWYNESSDSKRGMSFQSLVSRRLDGTFEIHQRAKLFTQPERLLDVRLSGRWHVEQKRCFHEMERFRILEVGVEPNSGEIHATDAFQIENIGRDALTMREESTGKVYTSNRVPPNFPLPALSQPPAPTEPMPKSARLFDAYQR